MSKAAVPVIDISPYRGADAAARRALAAEVDRTCREIGFMVISRHGIDPDLIAAVEDVSRTFFDLPLELWLSMAQQWLVVRRSLLTGQGLSRVFTKAG